MSRRCSAASILVLIIALILPACAPQVLVTPFSTKPSTPTPPPITSTPAARSLTICLGEEPNTLYPYGDLNSAAHSVLSAIYDGPMDVADYGYEPIILEKIPNLEDGDAQVSPVTVNAGSEIVDSSGNLAVLNTGVKVRPSGCRSDDCAITYDGSTSIQMDQMVVTFTMLKGLMWSDGEPLTASDSIYSFGLASNAATPSSKFLVDRTATYEAADDQTVQWWGKPGFIDPEYYTNFWMPLPEHAWSEFPPADLLKVEVSSKLPLGWGPYIIDEWEPGKRLHFIKNLNYFRASSGLPKFDELTFLVFPDANAAVSALVDGTCDLLDPSTRLDGQVGLLQQMQHDHRARLFTAPTMTMEWLGFGITHASYDDGFDIKKDRPDFFGDKRTRQAIALCLDRQKIVDTVLFGLSKVPDSYLPPDHPLHNANLQTYEFNPVSGNQILQQVGWIDHDNNPSTPRQALTVTNVPVNTPLVLNYFTSSATQRHQVAEIIAQSLAECGIGLNVIYSTASDLYAQGPAGPLFGRQFDLAEYAIGVDSLEPQCSWFTSSQIPNESNHWIGTNVTGYKNPNFDAACQKALQSVSTDPEYAFHQEAQAIFAADAPAIPLYLRLKVAASRSNFCGFTLDPFSTSALADIETFDYGEGCAP
ncbi:MAG TPA: ABC transporter substrate-binding protein [Anaerolineales bacterium]|nr:ABC transporter substrate-binding protein [Anaerolineales bacterium]HLO31436.1 ABC transporter substrate-binding protein [Anaerolineales bacterium]